MLVICLECNKQFKLLQSHLRHKHKMTTDEYRLKYGNDAQFMSDEVLQKKKLNGYSCWSVKDRISRGETEEEALLNIAEKRKETFSSETSCRSVLHWKRKGFSDEYAKERVSQIQSRGLDYFLRKYGDEGQERFKSFKTKAAKSNSKEYMLSNGLTEQEIRLMRDNYSVDSLMQKYSISFEDAERLRTDRLKNYTSVWKIEHWLNKGFSENDAKERVAQLQRRDLNFFVKKYGEIEGKTRYNTFLKAVTSHSVGKFPSKESVKFFEPLTEWCNQNSIEILFEKYVSIDTKIYYIDCVIPSISLAIEYDGEAYHADPKNINESWKSAKGNCSYWDSIEGDMLKTKRLESIGYTVIRVHSTRKDEFDLIEIVKDMLNGNF